MDVIIQRILSSAYIMMDSSLLGSFLYNQLRVASHFFAMFCHFLSCHFSYDTLSTYLLLNNTQQLAAGLCCGLSCLAAGGTIGILGDVGVRAFGLKAEAGRKWYWNENEGHEDLAVTGGGGGGGTEEGGGGGKIPEELLAMSRMNPAEASNKLYVGMLIMLIFSEALALYGLIVALILSQHYYVCG